MAKVKVGRKAVEKALREFIPRHIDYDIAKELGHSELEGLDEYPHLAGAFLAYLKEYA
ncbi:hypothetical protein [Rhodococcus sp. 06-156-3C]|uniref:hypothetical protein n=1 Tax=Rhodococcus sp. 06-156-3C TaxID=2022486 RepID=UPI0015963581|nr:hypothetical protein [Rhodococcus sp. 06-156-3C]